MPKLLVLGLGAGYFFVLLDVIVVNVALPQINADLHAGQAGIAGVINAYTLVLAALLLAFGAIGVGLLTPAIVAAAMHALPQRPGFASGAGSTARNVGGGMRVTVFAVLYTGDTRILMAGPRFQTSTKHRGGAREWANRDAVETTDSQHRRESATRLRHRLRLRPPGGSPRHHCQ